ncbi:hypothetical protein JXA40_02740, partial [bacterium]|nr:hypothetical protein [candidate division CSSED10-310 bacterium]
MNKCIGISVLFMWIVSIASGISAGDLDRNLAVLNFKAQNTGATDAVIVSDQIRSGFVSRTNLVIVDRVRMDAILKEQSVQLHDCTESSCAVRAGELLNVRWIVMGSFSKFGKRFLVNAELVDVESGRIARSCNRKTDSQEDLLIEIPGIVLELTPPGAETTGQPPETRSKTIPPVQPSGSRSPDSVPLPVVRTGGEPPTVTFLETPKGSMSFRDAKNVTFRFRGSDDRCIEGYRYRLDDQAVQETKRSEVAIESVGLGSHTFQVQAVDCDGNDSDPIRYQFQVKNLPPTVEISEPGDGGTASGKKLKVVVAGTDPEGEALKYRCAVNCPENYIEQASGTFEFEVADGSLMIYAQALDGSGSESDWVTRKSEFRYRSESHGDIESIDLGGGIRMEMVYIQPGNFQMGSKDGDDDEKPVH